METAWISKIALEWMNEWILRDYSVPEQVFIAYLKYGKEEAAKCCVSWTTEKVKQCSEMYCLVSYHYCKMEITFLEETFISVYSIGFTTSGVTSLADDLPIPFVSKVQKLFQKLPWIQCQLLLLTNNSKNRDWNKDCCCTEALTEISCYIIGV